MLRLTGNRTHLWQWDADQLLVVERADVAEVHFRDLAGDTAMVLDVTETDGNRVVQIPNILLQQARTIDAYACRVVNGQTTLEHVPIEVMARQRPSDYVYTETEIKRWETLEERIEALEQGGGSSGSGGSGGSYVLPVATATRLGGVKVGDGLAVEPDGTLNVEPGLDGVSVTHTWNGTILTVSSASGTSSANLAGPKGDTPVKGVDYYTTADKNEIVSLVLNALPAWQGGSY